MKLLSLVSYHSPLLVYVFNKGIECALLKILGVKLLHISHINILQIATGGRLSSFYVWTE